MASARSASQAAAGPCSRRSTRTERSDGAQRSSGAGHRGGQGIGRAIALRFARLVSLQEVRLREATGGRGGRSAHRWSGDLSERRAEVLDVSVVRERALHEVAVCVDLLCREALDEEQCPRLSRTQIAGEEEPEV